MTLPACSSLFQSGPVQATADGQVFQSAVFNAVAGTATVDLNGHSGIGLKNCVVYHNGGQGLKALVAGNGCWLDTVSFINLAAPAAGGSGGPYNSADVACRNIDLAGQTNFVVKDVYCQDGSRGIALANCTATMITRFHAQNMRGVNPAASSVLAGQAISVAACVDFMLDDFYIYNDPANSFPEDNINLWEVLQAMLAGGLIDGNNSIDGAGIEVDLDSGNCSISDIDALNMNNQGFGNWTTGGYNPTFTRCRVANMTASSWRGAGAGRVAFAGQPAGGNGSEDFADCAYYNLGTAQSYTSQVSEPLVAITALTSFTPRDHYAFPGVCQ
ncbi:MAG: hypothetical protein ACLQIQ_08535 [Beijerinckiaceae bacterium]